jgi:hypothetical protein
MIVVMSRRVMKYPGMSLSVLYFITLLDMTTITVIDHGMSLSVLYFITLLDMTTITVIDHGMSLSVLYPNMVLL